MPGGISKANTEDDFIDVQTIPHCVHNHVLISEMTTKYITELSEDEIDSSAKPRTTGLEQDNVFG